VAFRKRFVNFLALIGAVVLCGVTLSLAASAAGDSPWFRQDRIALLSLVGVIGSDEQFIFELDEFLADESVKGIVVYIDSPGGAVAPSQSIYQELRRARENGLPIVASIGSVGASGGYYAALAADSILALPGSITGSIGVVMEFPNTQELMGKVGVSMEVIKSSEHKDIGSPFRGVTDGDRAILTAMISDVYDQFVSVVAAERGISDTEVRRLADGRLLSGRQAVAAGLVDRTGNLTDAIALAGRMAGLGDTPEVVRPPEPEHSLVDLLLGVRTSELAQRLGSGIVQLQGPRLRYLAH
jgi:protease-4